MKAKIYLFAAVLLQLTLAVKEDLEIFPHHVKTDEQRRAHYSFVVNDFPKLFSASRAAVAVTEGREGILEEVIKSHRETILRIQDETHDEYNKMERFVLRYPDNCGHKCHEPMQSEFGIYAYMILNHNTALLTVTMQVMGELKGRYPDRILDFSPLLPGFNVAENILATCFDYQKAISNSTTRPNLEYIDEQGQVRKQDAADSPPPTMITVMTTELDLSEIGVLIDRVEFVTKKGLTLKSPLNELSDGIKNFLTFWFDGDSEDSKCSSFDRMVSEVSALRGVEWIERKFQSFTSNRWTKGVCQTASSTYEPFTLRSGVTLTGAGQIVGVSDTGLDTSSCYFYDPDVPDSAVKSKDGSKTSSTHRKLVQYIGYVDFSDDVLEQHGTHVCGTIAGSALGAKSYGDFVKFNGMATSAKLAFFDIGDNTGSLSTPPDIWHDMLNKQYAAGARIFSESWGCKATDTGCGGAYNTNSMNADWFMWTHPDALVLIANGNAGASAAGSASTVGAPATAKSCVGVGASLSETNVFKAFSSSVPDGVTSDFNIDALAFFSSRGPTSDNRVKPEVTAPGWWTTSAAGRPNSTSVHCTIKTLQGTSMATPATAGMAVIIRQYFMSGFYGSTTVGVADSTKSFTPSGALIKAMLIHSAIPLTKAVEVSTTTGHTVVNTWTSVQLPDNNQGYGRIQLDNVLYFGGAASLLCSVAANCPVETGSTTSPSHTYPTVANILSLTYFVWGGVSMHSSNVSFNQLGQYFYFQTPTSASLSAIKITLAWTDYPGYASSSSTESQLVNPLDVYVEGPVTSNAACTSSSTPPCSVYNSLLYKSTTAPRNPHAMVKIPARSLVSGSVYRIYVGPWNHAVSTRLTGSGSTPTTINIGQPFALVATTENALLASSSGGGSLKPYTSADVSFPKYTMPGSPATYVSSVATTLIVVFSIVVALLGGIVGVIYMSHKQAARLEEEEIAQRIGDAMVASGAHAGVQ